jgi:poly(A) polymerase/tRNA nucleotidyltransferase (CCA-adding enzyme)
VIDFFALPGVAKIWAVLPEARIVGGAVRDALSGRAISDIDFASPLPPEAVMARCQAAGIKTVPTGLSHGTVTAVVGGAGFEITTLRRDVATDGRHAEVAFTDDWQQDAARRDFTINAMFCARDGEITDYFGGQDDLAAGRVRFVGDAAARIEEDFLRIFRFFRFWARYGGGAPDAAAVAAITALRDGVLNLSVERMWREIKYILQADEPLASVRLMAATGVLGLLFAADVERLAWLLARGAPADVMLRMAALLAEDAAGFAERFKLSGEEAAMLVALQGGCPLTPAADDAELRRALADEGADTLVQKTWLLPGDWADVRARIFATERPVFPLQGRDLLALGLPPGPDMGRILDAVRAWWMAGGCVADVSVCLEEVRRFL